MLCTLLIPDLWWSRDEGSEPYRNMAVPALQTVLARSQRAVFPAIAWEAWLCQAFEVERQRDWPVAALTVSVDGGDPGEYYWLRADPVHLHADRDRLLLADGSFFTLTQCEAQNCVEALNAHFASDGLTFSAPHENRWYLRLEADAEIETVLLDEVAGMPVDGRLPSGPSALRWHRILNEVQMLLHALPLNEAREARGELPVNGVWLWGGGRHAPVRGRHFASVTAGEPLSLAIAANADITAGTLPEDGHRWLLDAHDPATDKPRLVVLDQLVAHARRGDLSAWRAALEALERRWIAPVLAAVQDARIAQLAIVAPGLAGCARHELRRRDLLKLWRRPKQVSVYMPA
jgi:hypothetical protein